MKKKLIKNELIDGEKENFFSIAEIFLILAKYFKLILILPLFLCLITSFYLIFFSEPVFTSISKIMSSSKNSRVTQAMGLAAQFGINLTTDQAEPNWAYPEIIRSRTLAKSVLSRRFNSNRYGPNQTLIQILTKDEKKKNIGLDTLETIAIKYFQKNIRVNEDLKTLICTISLDAFEPKLAKDINKAIIEELDSHQKNYNKNKTSEAKLFIQDRIIDVEKELHNAEEKLKDFTIRNKRIDNSALLLLEQQRLSREVSVLTGVYTTLKQQLETTKIEEVKDSDYVIIIDEPNVPIQKSKPNNKTLVLLAGLFGLGLSFTYILLSEFFLKTTKKEKEKILMAKRLLSQNIFNAFRKN